MEPLACLDHFDFDDTTFPPTHSVDGMHAEAAIRNQPGHHQLSHWPSLANTPWRDASDPHGEFCIRLNSHRSPPWRKSAGDNFGSAPRPSGDRCLVTYERSSLLRTCWRLCALA